MDAELIAKIRVICHDRNPAFDYTERKVRVVVDTPEVPDFVLEHLELLGFTVSGKYTISETDLQSYQTVFQQHISQHFETLCGMLTIPVSRETLKQVTTDEHLARLLETDMSIQDILKHEFERLAVENITTYALDTFLSDSFDTSGHVVALLQSTPLVAPLLPSPGGELCYHAMGRGGKVYGYSGTLHRGQRQYMAVVNATPFSENPEFSLENFALEMINHELLGGGIMRLHVHLGMDPEQCLMALKKTDAEYVEATRRQKGLYLCKECSVLLPQELPKELAINRIKEKSTY